MAHFVQTVAFFSLIHTVSAKDEKLSTYAFLFSLSIVIFAVIYVIYLCCRSCLSAFDELETTFNRSSRNGVARGEVEVPEDAEYPRQPRAAEQQQPLLAPGPNDIGWRVAAPSAPPNMIRLRVMILLFILLHSASARGANDPTVHKIAIGITVLLVIAILVVMVYRGLQCLRDACCLASDLTDDEEEDNDPVTRNHRVTQPIVRSLETDLETDLDEVVVSVGAEYPRQTRTRFVPLHPRLPEPEPNQYQKPLQPVQPTIGWSVNAPATTVKPSAPEMDDD